MGSSRPVLVLFPAWIQSSRLVLFGLVAIGVAFALALTFHYLP
jgi:hypothetical protein